MAKRPEKPVSHERRAFFRQLFVKAVEKVEEAGRNFADRAGAGFRENAGSTPSSYYSYSRDQHDHFRGRELEVYGPPWPPPYGPPIPAKLKAEMNQVAARSVPRNG